MEFRFQKFQVYQDAKNLHTLVLRMVAKFAPLYGYLADQMKRAALSVVLNIAEGSAKKSDKDFNRYLMNALGSVNELAAALDVCLDERLITSEQQAALVKALQAVRGQLGGFSKKLQASK